MLRALLVAFVLAFFAAPALADSEPVGGLLGPVQVVRVIDGDTVVLQSDLGPRSVRLIGIDAPEAHRPDRAPEPFWNEAAELAERLLPVGAYVWVELDLEVEDAYGRLLAYLYVEDAAGDWIVEGTRARMVNLAIAEAGYARTLPIPPNLVYADLFRDAVRSARDQELGMWRSAPRPTAEDGATASPTASALPSGPIVIACALYDPDVPNEIDAETVTLLLRERIDTRGYYLQDRGSGTVLPLPPGEHGPGELVIRNPGQGIWNNSGDTIYLERAGTVVDEWDYTGRRADANGEACR